jgi:hypothetical protein
MRTVNFAGLTFVLEPVGDGRHRLVPWREAAQKALNEEVRKFFVSCKQQPAVAEVQKASGGTPALYDLPAFSSEAERQEQELFDKAKKYKESGWFGGVFVPQPNHASFSGFYEHVSDFRRACPVSSKDLLWVWGVKLAPVVERPGMYNREPDYTVAVLLQEET